MLTATPHPFSVFPMSFSVVEVPSKEHAHFESCKKIRLEVFVEEQGVDADSELDDIDDHAQHFLITWKADSGENEIPVATMRMFSYDVPEQSGNLVLKMGRIAVVKSFRKHGLGRKLLEVAEHYAVSRSAEQQKPGVFLYLHSQSDKHGFYTRFGYSVVRSAAQLDELRDGKLIKEPDELELKSLEFVEDGILHVRMAKYIPCPFDQRKC
ncbi:hypothetical protein R1sor_024791 [Riccia sorocarpa]|uniref:N-acetyltransferase domain-containing protein n=1 Tax=Riccia sorocarpa TaxID=122646 RepID=A0ABD3GUQ0_9MARC